MKLVTMIRPLLQTLASLYANLINPSHDVAVWFLFNYRCNDSTNDDAVNNGYESLGGKFYLRRRWIGRWRM